MCMLNSSAYGIKSGTFKKIVTSTEQLKLIIDACSQPLGYPI